MGKKTGKNFYLPAAIQDLFDELSARVSGKEKWQIISAAIVSFAELDEEEQNRQIKRIRDAEGPGGSFERLVLEAVRPKHDVPGVFRTSGIPHSAGKGLPSQVQEEGEKKKRKSG